MRRIGLILANDPEGLLPAVSPAKSDGHAERGATFVGRRRDHFRTCAPRTPVTDFPLHGRGSLCVALILIAARWAASKRPRATSIAARPSFVTRLR